MCGSGGPTVFWGYVLRQLKLSFVGLIASLAALFSIGPLSQMSAGGGSVPVAAHLLTAVLVLALITTRLSLRAPAAILVAGTAVIYVASRAFGDDSNNVGSVSTALLTALDVALASMTVLLSIRVAHGLRQFEESVENITLDERTGVVSLECAREDIAIEMSRARRHERPLTVTVLTFDPRAVHASLHEIVRDVQQRMMHRYIMSGLARVAAQTTRRGDIVVQDPAANRVIVLSPESTPGQLDALTNRLQESAYHSLGVPIRLGSAGFPASALTFDDLVAHASGDADADTAIELSGLARAYPVRTGPTPDAAALPAMRTLYRGAADAGTTSQLGETARVVNGD